MTEPAVTVRALRKSYDSFEAVKGIDLDVRHGEVFAFLGPNGAGKTTTVEILEGYRERSDGEVSVLGVDPARPDARVAIADRDRAPVRQARALPDGDARRWPSTPTSTRTRARWTRRSSRWA